MICLFYHNKNALKFVWLCVVLEFLYYVDETKQKVILVVYLS